MASSYRSETLRGESTRTAMSTLLLRAGRRALYMVVPVLAVILPLPVGAQDGVFLPIGNASRRIHEDCYVDPAVTRRKARVVHGSTGLGCNPSSPRRCAGWRLPTDRKRFAANPRGLLCRPCCYAPEGARCTW